MRNNQHIKWDASKYPLNPKPNIKTIILIFIYTLGKSVLLFKLFHSFKDNKQPRIVLVAPCGIGDICILKSILKYYFLIFEKYRIGIITKSHLKELLSEFDFEYIHVFDHNKEKIWSWIKLIYNYFKVSPEIVIVPGSWRGIKLDILAYLIPSKEKIGILRDRPRFFNQKFCDRFYTTLFTVDKNIHEKKK